MTTHLLKLLPVLITFLFISCGDVCRTVDCDGRTEFVDLRLMRNQVNALFGPDAFLHQDSIHTYLAYSSGVATPVVYKLEEQTLSLFIEEGAPVVLEINNSTRDTFSIITALFGWDDCCLFYRTDTIFRNDSVICSGWCINPIEIEI